MKIKEFDRFIRNLLKFDMYKSTDPAINGLQVTRSRPEIKKIVFAVDAAMESFRCALEHNADMLFVHHGLLWKASQTLTGEFYARIRFLIEHDLALYTAHLPLDSHAQLGNNINIARQLGLIDIEPFGEYYTGVHIGYKGKFSSPASITKVVELTCGHKDNCIRMLPFGKKQISTVGIVSGGVPHAAFQAIKEDLDLFITGDASHEVYHSCLEAGLNVIFGGHYLTETYGVKAMAAYLCQTCNLETEFIDIPTGL
jgi:dinuclear metal center YbgI/SA1388 family protein